MKQVPVIYRKSTELKEKNHFKRFLFPRFASHFYVSEKL